MRALLVREISLAETRPLRQSVLRPHESVQELAAHEPAGAFAVGAFDSGQLIAVGLIAPSGEFDTWRVRGMATTPLERGNGAGMAVLEALLRHARARGAACVWCNAREPARSFYERAGFRVRSDVFELPDIGPHFVMEMALPDPLEDGLIEGRRASWPPLGLVVFVVGSASLGAEIAAARLLAPYFGASTFVWANTIATVLVALSVGYAIGGRLADHAPRMSRLCEVVLVAGILLGAVPFVSPPLLRFAVGALSSISVGGFVASLLGVLTLVAVPVLLLGMVAPFAIRLSIHGQEDAGRVSGRLYAISTSGSLLGTFLAALVLIPFAGTHRTFLVFALALTLVAAMGLGRGYWLVPVALVVLIVLPPGAINHEVARNSRVIYETETEYQYARVVERPEGQRWLQLNEGVAIHSEYIPGRYLTGNYWDDFLVLPFASRPLAPALLAVPRSLAPARVAILGDAAGTTARAVGHYFPRTTIDAVEIDSQLTTIGRRYFDLIPRPQLHTITADARPWLASVKSSYDAIFVDAYRQPYIPFYLTTRQFFALVRSHLRPGGVVAVNVGHPVGSNELERVISATLQAIFPYVVRDPSEPTNTLVEASEAPLSSTSILAAAPTLAPDLRPTAEAAALRLAPALRGGPVYTDDRAPVEWLIDQSLLGYATGPR